MAVNGIFVSDAGALNERKGDFATSVLMSERGTTSPILALSAMMPSSDISDVTTTWYEQDIRVYRTIITAITDPIGASMTVEDATWMHENMVFMVESTGEYVFVKAISSNVLTVQRALGGTQLVPIDITAGPVHLQLVGTAFEEASERPTGHSVNPYPRTNVTQIFRTGWDISASAVATQYKFGSRLLNNRQYAAVHHAETIEHGLLWSRRHIGVVKNKPHRQMDGILNQIRTNRFVSPAGGLTRRALGDYIERLFAKNIKGEPNDRITFCGNATLRALEEITMRYSTYNITEGETAFGIKTKIFQTSLGSITLVQHPLMQGSGVWAAEMYSLHPAALELKYLRRTKHEEDLRGSASNLRDATAGAYTTELTVCYRMEQTGAIMSGIEPNHFVV